MHEFNFLTEICAWFTLRTSSRTAFCSSKISLSLSLVLFCFSSGLGFGQLGRSVAQLPEETGSVLLTAPREVRRLVQKAEEAIEEGRWSDAVDQLGILLNSEDIEDYFIDPKHGGTTTGSLKGKALNLLGSMPQDGLEAYDLIYGAEANAKLKTAIINRDFEALSNVARFYYYTQAGYQATILLSRLELDQGQPLAAALRLQKLNQLESRFSKYDAEISVLLALSWYRGGVLENAIETLEAFKQKYPDSKINIGTYETSIFSDKEDANSWLEKYFGEKQPEHILIPDQWVLYRGDAKRNAESQGSEPLKGLNWRVRIARSKQDAIRVDADAQLYIQKRTAALPMSQPLVINSQVLLRTPWNLLGVDLESGKVNWSYPGGSFDSQNMALNTNGQSSTSADVSKIQERIWTDSSYGQFTSDGSQIYLIEELDRGSASAINQNNPFFQIVRKAMPNQLRCLDLAREGATVWISGNGSNNELREARFLGSPLPVENSLYCLVEINAEIRLVVLNPKDGSIQWSQQLAQVDPNSQDVDRMRHTYGASPSYSNGILVCPTNVGVVVAIDTFNRSILWGNQYKVLDRTSRSPRIGIRRTTNNDDPKIGKRWNDATVTIDKNRVVLTPPESQRIFCIDLTSGKKLWERPREEGLYLATIQNDIAMVVGQKSIKAFDINSGEPAWDKKEVRIPAEGIPSGRGFKSDDHYFLPTTSKQILKVNLATGELGPPIESNGVLGNLVCHDKFVISQGINWVASFKQIDALRAEVELLLAENPNDPVALRDYGELLVHDGETKNALDSLRKSLNFRDSDETLQIFINTALNALKENFSEFEAVVQELETLIKLPEDRLELTRLIAMGYQNRNETRKAFEAYLLFLDQQENFFSDGSANNYLRIDNNLLSVHQDRWVRGNLASLYKQADPETAKWIDEQLTTLQAKHSENNNIQSLRKFITRFGTFSLSNPVKLKLAKLLIAESKHLEAELLLNQLIVQEEDLTLAGQATAQQAKLFTSLGHEYDAAILYQMLATKFRDVRCENGRTGKQIVALMLSNSASGKLIRNQKIWQYSQPTINQSPYDIPPFKRFEHPLTLTRRDNIGYLEERIRLDQDSNHLYILNPYGQERIRFPLSTISGAQLYNTQIGTIFIEQTGHLLVTSLGSEVQAFNSLNHPKDETRERLWGKNLKPQLPGTSARTSKVSDSTNSDNPFGDYRRQAHDSVSGKPIGQMTAITPQGICYQRGQRLICVDPLTGDSHWERDGFTEGSYLAADQSTLVVIPPTDHEREDQTEDATLVNLDNGTIIEKVNVPTPKLIWTSIGTNLISWKYVDGKLELLSFEPESATETWNLPVEDGSKGKLLSPTELALMAPSGLFQLIDLQTGDRLISKQLDEVPNLTQIRVLASHDQFQVLTYEPKQGNNNTSYRSIPYDGNQDLVNGYLYGFDRNSGELLWSSPEKISNYHLWTQLQPSELPVIAFLSRLNRNNAKTPQTKVALGLLMIDRRDGRVLIRKNLDMYSQSYILEGDPNNNIIKLKLAEAEIALKFLSDESPIAPAPPVSTEREFDYPKEISSKPAEESSLLPENLQEKQK